MSRQRALNHVRDELFRKLLRAVVVRAIRGECRKAVGMKPGAGQKIA